MKTYRVTIAHTRPNENFRVDSNDVLVEAGSEEEAIRKINGPRVENIGWTQAVSAVAVDEIPALEEKQRLATLEKFNSPAEVAKRATSAAALEKQRAGSRADNARRRAAK